MSHAPSPLLCLLLTAAAAGPVAAQATRAPYTEGSVWNMQFIRVKPGLQDDYLNGVRATAKRLFDNAKRQGLILSYHLISAPSATPQDWDLLLMIEYKNYAALDGLREKIEPIAAQAIGGESERRTVAGRRNELREIVGTKLGRELILRDSTASGRSGQ
jgi:hypothetical protein